MRALARENENIVDGPYAGRFTGYGKCRTSTRACGGGGGGGGGP